MNPPLLTIAAGGTGGHMFPAQALAEEMLKRGWRVELSTDARGARFAGGFPEAVAIRQVASATTARGGILGKLQAPFVLAGGLARAVRRLKRDKPAVVVGFGGYPSVPALGAATILKIPRIIHEANGVLGRVNQAFATRVDSVACGIWPTKLPDGAKGWHCGNPVRQQVLDRAGSPYIPPGDYPMSVLVLGGSQGARILSDVVPAALAALPEDLRRHIRVAHQARVEDHDRVTAHYATYDIKAEVAPFFADIARRMTEAQLVISRAGASTIADLTVIGRPSILIPYAAAAGDHQSFNARGLVDLGGAVMLNEADASPDRVAAEVAAILRDEKRALQMSRAAAQAGIPDAAVRLADRVVELAGTKDVGQSDKTSA